MLVEEVHLWRGSDEQRALRSLVGKLGRFRYFDQQLDRPDWAEKVVLDFGGNEGNLLLDEDCSIRHERYYCLDVIEEALREGSKRFPRANWIHYNRYNCSFNPQGVVGLPLPDMGTEFDLILAYSVFTHTTREEMHDLVAQLRACLAPGGTLAFTFIDPHYHSWPDTYGGDNLRWRLEKSRAVTPSFDVEGLMEKSRGANWCALVNGSELYVNDNGTWPGEDQGCVTYNVFYSVEFLRREFPGATLLPPVNREMQHCCLIGRPAS